MSKRQLLPGWTRESWYQAMRLVWRLGGIPNFWFAMVEVGPDDCITIPVLEDEVQWVFCMSGSEIRTAVVRGLDEVEINRIRNISGGKYTVEGGVWRR